MAPPEEWGPPAWCFIFTVIESMPEYPANTEYYQMFFESFIGVLPCEECRAHYRRYIENNPVPVWSRKATYDWAMKLRMNIRERKRKNNPKKFLGLF